jgi:hypothetical protein
LGAVQGGSHEVPDGEPDPTEGRRLHDSGDLNGDPKLAGGRRSEAATVQIADSEQHDPGDNSLTGNRIATAPHRRRLTLAFWPDDGNSVSSKDQGDVLGNDDNHPKLETQGKGSIFNVFEDARLAGFDMEEHSNTSEPGRDTQAGNADGADHHKDFTTDMDASSFGA